MSASSRRIREDEDGPTHCVECKAEFGKPRVLAKMLGVSVHGDMVYADYQGSVLCETCADEMESKEMNR